MAIGVGSIVRRKLSKGDDRKFRVMDIRQGYGIDIARLRLISSVELVINNRIEEIHPWDDESEFLTDLVELA